MDLSSIQFLTSSVTYQEFALRSQELLTYQHQPEDSELRQLAEDTFFNLAVEYLIQAGIPQQEAEQFCNDPSNAIELAMRVASILGPAYE